MENELSMNQEENKETMASHKEKKASFKKMEGWLAPISS